MSQTILTARDMLIRWIDELDRSAIRLRDMSRFCKQEAQKIEEQALRLRGSLPPAPDEDDPDGEV